MGSLERRLEAVEMEFLTEAVVDAMVKVEVREMLSALKPELESGLYGKVVRIIAEGGYIEEAGQWGA